MPGPDRSISDKDIKNLTMRSKRYRNRRIGDFLKELHLVEGRNTGMPTALRAIKNNGSPLPTFLTNEDRTFFSVILPIHKAFIDDKIDFKNKETHTRRKLQTEIKEDISSMLNDKNYSAKALYHMLDYSGNVSKAFRTCIEDLINSSQIKYLEKNKNSSNDVLTKLAKTK